MTSKNDRFKECLSDMRKVLTQYDTQFFLTCGTLLGQQRENDFIEHDDDIDLGILHKDFVPGLNDKIMASGYFEKYRVMGDLNKSRELTYRHNNGTHIGIYVYYPCPEANQGENYYYYPTFFGLCSNKPEGFCKWGRHIDGFKTVEFMGETYNIPTNAESYLVEEYGEDWRIPKVFGYLEGLAGEVKNMIN